MLCYSATSSNATNPNLRRQFHADVVLEFLRHTCGKAICDFRFYKAIQRDFRIARYEADEAIDDLVAIGRIHVRPAGWQFVIELAERSAK